MSKYSNKVAGTAEVLGAVLTEPMTQEEAKAFAADPQGTIYAKLDVEVPENSISVVENSADEVHLALPYYEALHHPHAEQLRDETMSEAVGGEFIFSAYIFPAILVGLLILMGVIATSIGVDHTQRMKKQGKK